MTPYEAAELIADVDDMDLPDGAHFAMLEELSGMDAIDLYMLAGEYEDNQSLK